MKSKDHKTELKARKVYRSICVEPGCKYKGSDAVQGHCHTRHPKLVNDYIDRVAKHGEGLLAEMKSLRKTNKQTTDAKWIKYLEGHVVTTWMNDWFTLDALIRLRAENAALRLAAGKKARG